MKTKIIITFDAHNLPHAEIRNASRDQIIDASVFLNGIYRSKKPVPKANCNKLCRFFKCWWRAIKQTYTEHKSSDVEMYQRYRSNVPKIGNHDIELR